MSELKINIIEKGASSEIIRENYSLDQQGISDWLKSKNIIRNNIKILTYRDLFPWNQFGGETYCTSFEFSTKSFSKQIMIKALTIMFPETSLNDWLRRRKILSENSIPVSKWYYYGNAIIIEDFYPISGKDVAFKKILPIGHKLDHLGFSTLKFIDDIRADKNKNPFYIDFGFDLGEPSKNISTTAKETLLNHFPNKQDLINSYYTKS